MRGDRHMSVGPSPGDPRTVSPADPLTGLTLHRAGYACYAVRQKVVAVTNPLRLLLTYLFCNFV
jgi:hypothetical protein